MYIVETIVKTTRRTGVYTVGTIVKFTRRNSVHIANIKTKVGNQEDKAE